MKCFKLCLNDERSASHQRPITRCILSLCQILLLLSIGGSSLPPSCLWITLEATLNVNDYVPELLPLLEVRLRRLVTLLGPGLAAAARQERTRGAQCRKSSSTWWLVNLGSLVFSAPHSSLDGGVNEISCLYTDANAFVSPRLDNVFRDR